MKRGWSSQGGWPLFLNLTKNPSMNWKAIGFSLVYLTALAIVLYWIYARSITATKRQMGNITYLIFERGNNLSVVNYTSDSMEWEFLHQPTKTQSNEPDSFFPDHSELKQVQQPE
jgi:predicted ABC-type exoprotein transport system permease subunit